MSKAQTKRRRRPKPGDLGALRRTLWASLRDVEDILRDPEAAVDERLRAAHALSALSGQYLKTTEIEALADRVEALEQAIRGQEGTAA